MSCRLESFRERYPKREENDENGKEVWSLYFVDERIDSVLGLIDSALLTIDRN